MNKERIQRIACETMKRKAGLNIMLVIMRQDYKLTDWSCPPIGIAYVSAALKKGGFSVYTVNMTEEDGKQEDIIKQLVVENDIDVVATGILTAKSEVDNARLLFDTARSVKADIITYVGGGFPTVAPYEALVCTGADIGMIGEGEITACELMQALEIGKDLNAVKGLCFFETDENKFVITESRPLIDDLDSLPWPDWDGFKFFDSVNRLQDISTCIVTSRGCPFPCTFCSKPTGRKYRKRSLDNTFLEIDYLVNHYGVSRIFFDDDLFAEQKERLIEFCERIKAYKVRWLVYLRVGNSITKEMLGLMRDSGCEEIYYGIESGDNTVLKSMKKGITVDEIEEAVKRTAESGIRVQGSFIFGDTAETMETVQNTFDFAWKLRDYFTNLIYNPIKLFPGSALYEKAVKEGKINDTVEFITNDLPETNVSKLSDDEYRYLVEVLIPQKRIEYMQYKSNRSDRIELKLQNREMFGIKKCEFCNKEQNVRVRAALLPFYTAHICDCCGRRNDILTMRAYAELVNPFLERLVSEKKVAFWGCGMWLQYFAGFSDILKHENVILIDNAIRKFKGYDVYKPQDILDNGIDTVVVTAPGVYSYICRSIEERYKAVKEIYRIDELYYYVGR